MKKDDDSEGVFEKKASNEISAKTSKSKSPSNLTEGNILNGRGAARLLMEMLDSANDYETARNAFGEWLEKDEKSALSCIWIVHDYLHLHQLDQKDFGDFVADFLYGKYGNEQSMELLASFSYDEQLIRLTYESLIEKWVAEDSVAFKKWWEDSPLVNHRHTIERLIKAQFANNDPVESIKFHESLSSSDNRKEYAMTTAYEHFADYHQQVAIKYLETLPPTEFANGAYWKLAVKAAGEAAVPIEKAVAWSEKIHEDEANRKSTLAEALSQYAYKRNDEYQNWLDTTNYFEGNDSIKKEIVEMVEHLTVTAAESDKAQASQRDNPDSPYYVPSSEESTSENL